MDKGKYLCLHGNFGLNKYQVRSEVAIDRILALISLCYFYCVLSSEGHPKLGVGLRSVRAAAEREKVALIYDAGKNGIPLEEFSASLNLHTSIPTGFERKPLECLEKFQKKR